MGGRRTRLPLLLPALGRARARARARTSLRASSNDELEPDPETEPPRRSPAAPTHPPKSRLDLPAPPPPIWLPHLFPSSSSFPRRLLHFLFILKHGTSQFGLYRAPGAAGTPERRTPSDEGASFENWRRALFSERSRRPGIKRRHMGTYCRFDAMCRACRPGDRRPARAGGLVPPPRGNSRLLSTARSPRAHSLLDDPNRVSRWFWLL